MNQKELIERICAGLDGFAGIGSAFLGGSHGTGEADAYSDVDVYAVVAEATDIEDVFPGLAQAAPAICPLIFVKVLPNARTITCITEEWLRFDLTVVHASELARLAGGGARPLFDRLGLAEGLATAPQPESPVSAQTLLDIVEEFIRVLGLSVVVKGRDDPVLGETGANLLRDMLIRTMALENAPQPRRGALALRRDLKPDQIAELAALPPLAANWPSVFARTRAIATSFFPRARVLAEKLDAPWPSTFEAATRQHLKARIGLEF